MPNTASKLAIASALLSAIVDIALEETTDQFVPHNQAYLFRRLRERGLSEVSLSGDTHDDLYRVYLSIGSIVRRIVVREGEYTNDR